MKRLVIDTETTGLYPDRHQVLTVGMLLVDVNRNKLKFLEERHLFIKHSKYQVSRTAMRINKIDLVEHHKKGITPKNIHKEMKNFVLQHDLVHTPLVGHNVHFDLRFLGSLFNSIDKPFPLCVEKEDTRYIWDRLKRCGKISPAYNSKLGTLAEHFKIDYTKAHDALADCKITAEVYFRMLGV